MKPKFIIGIGLIVAAMIAVIGFSIVGNASVEVGVNDLLAQAKTNRDISQRSIKLSGIVVGDSIQYDPKTLHIEFDVVHSRNDLVNNLSKAQRVRVIYKGTKPDTLLNESEAIVTGKFADDGKFYAANSPDALLLRCPSKYVEENK